MFGQNRVPYGNPWPDFTGGFSTNFSYKNWSVSALFSFAVGQDYIASGENINSKYFANSSAITPLRHMLGRWRSPGDVTTIAQVNNEPTLWGRTSECIRYRFS